LIGLHLVTKFYQIARKHLNSIPALVAGENLFTLPMRKGYWILLVFAVWCVVSALWYMFSVKGLPDNTGLIKPTITSLAIAEIVVMITISFIIGFGMAWVNRSGLLEEATDELRNSKYEIRDLEAAIIAHKDAVGALERKAEQAEQKAANAQIASDHLAKRISELSSQEEQLKKRNRDLEVKVQQLDGEQSSAKFRMRILESDLDEKARAVGQLKDELAQVNSKPKAEHRDWSDHPFVRPIEDEGDEKDDLTQIKGIGPAFQRKLNSLDIYTFRQISELDGEGVERLAEVIEVFPDRIHRDNWIGQATRLYMKKLGREV
jgi:predicted flap endonuclease-1-like 5' DNA nuclease